MSYFERKIYSGQVFIFFVTKNNFINTRTGNKVHQGYYKKKASGVKSSVFIPEVSISNVGFVHHIHTYTFIKSNFLTHFTAPRYLSLLFCLTMTMCHEGFAINVAHLFTTSLYMIQTKTM